MRPLLLLFLAFLAGAHAWAQPARTLRLEPGQQLAVPLPHRLARLSIGDDAVVDAQPLRGAGEGDVLLLRARAHGSTELLVWSRAEGPPQTWRVQVASRHEGLLLEGSPAGRTLSGGVPDLATHRKALAAVETMTAAGTRAGGGAAVGARPAGTTVAGAVADQSQVGPGGAVQVEVKVVEFNRSDLREAGLDLSTRNVRGSFSFAMGSELAPIGAAFDLAASLMRGSFSLDARLRLMESNGAARVLAEPTLVAMSGQTASFLAGGEVPIPVPSGLGTTSIEYKSFGIGLQVTPTVLAPDRIVLKVAPEASDLDYGNAITLNNVSVPAISTRRTETMVELGDGESFVIGGLVSRTTESNVRKVPWLGDLPVLGPLFKSMQHSSSERELLIVVTPHMVRPLARGAAVPGLPGAAQDRPQHPWQDYLLGPAASRSTLPGFSR